MQNRYFASSFNGKKSPAVKPGHSFFFFGGEEEQKLSFFKAYMLFMFGAGSTRGDRPGRRAALSEQPGVLPVATLKVLAADDNM